MHGYQDRSAWLRPGDAPGWRAAHENAEDGGADDNRITPAQPDNADHHLTSYRAHPRRVILARIRCPRSHIDKRRHVGVHTGLCHDHSREGMPNQNGRTILPRYAANAHIPGIYPFRDMVVTRGLMAYYRDTFEVLRQVAYQVAQILNGKKPAEMPFRQPTSFKLSVSTKAARDIGVIVPPTLLASADEVIE